MAALRRLLDRRPDLSRDAVLHDFAEAESAQEHETPRMLYRDILARVHARLRGSGASKRTKVRIVRSVAPWAIGRPLPTPRQRSPI